MKSNISMYASLLALQMCVFSVGATGCERAISHNTKIDCAGMKQRISNLLLAVLHKPSLLSAHPELHPYNVLQALITLLQQYRVCESNVRLQEFARKLQAVITRQERNAQPILLLLQEYAPEVLEVGALERIEKLSKAQQLTALAYMQKSLKASCMSKVSIEQVERILQEVAG